MTNEYIGTICTVLAMFAGLILWLVKWVDGRIETKIKEHKLTDLIEENKRLREYAEKNK